MESQDEPCPISHSRPTTAWVGTATHIGRRDVNADAMLVEAAAGLFAVADGVGDEPRSRLAAIMALAAVRDLFEGGWAAYPPTARPIEEARERLKLGVERAHRRLQGSWWADMERTRATFAGVVVCGEHLIMSHVGDSRIYLLQTAEGGLVQQTTDHTVLGELVRQGMPYEEAASLPDAHHLTQVLGRRSGVDVRAFVRRWEPGDMVLLCTDGISDCVAPELMTEIILCAQDLGAAAQRLVDQAVTRGGQDNTTALLVRHAR